MGIFKKIINAASARNVAKRNETEYIPPMQKRLQQISNLVIEESKKGRFSTVLPLEWMTMEMCEELHKLGYSIHGQCWYFIIGWDNDNPGKPTRFVGMFYDNGIASYRGDIYESNYDGKHLVYKYKDGEYHFKSYGEKQ